MVVVGGETSELEVADKLVVLQLEDLVVEVLEMLVHVEPTKLQKNKQGTNKC